MIATIHQPEYMPCLTLLGKMAQADVLILLDDVQFKRDSLQQRAWVADERGKGRWLSIPFVHRHPQLIKDVEVADPRWGRNHLDIVHQLYRNAPHYERVTRLTGIWTSREQHVSRIACQTMDVLRQEFGAVQRVELSSEIPVDTEDKSERIARLCEVVGADTYLCGKSGAEYLDHEPFRERGIEIVVNRFRQTEPYRDGCPKELHRVSGLDAMLWLEDPASLMPTELLR